VPIQAIRLRQDYGVPLIRKCVWAHA